MQVFERVFDDPMYFWPFVPGASVSDRCDAAKRFGLYVMLIGGAVTWSVRAVVAGLIIIVLSHVFYCFDDRFAKKTADDANPYANYTMGRDFRTIDALAPSAVARDTYQSLADSPNESDMTRFVAVAHPDLMQRRRY
eukprot:jgi/Mesvir1/10936/Mv11477-RA.1